MVLPDGRCDIILRYNIHRANSPTPIITGPATEPYTVEYDAGDCWIGIRMRPANGFLLWRQKIAQSADKVLRGQDALAMFPRLGELKGSHLTLDNLLTILEDYISPMANNRLSGALDALHVSGGRRRINELSKYACCTTRQLNRMFRSNVGLSAKTYSQLVQFHRTLKLIQCERLPITVAAFEGGYADQAHLTRAFQRFGGFTPSNVPYDLSLPMLFT